MKMGKNKIEIKLERKRKIISFILTLIIHLAFIFLLIISGAFKLTKEETKVITVQLHDKIIEEFNQMSDSKKEKLIKEAEKKYKSIKKNQEKKIDSIKNRENREKYNENNAENLTEERQSNYYDEYKKKIEMERKKAEEEFFKKDEKKDDTQGIDELPDFNYNIENGSSKTKGESKKEDKQGNINWKGRPRALISESKINAPEEIAEKGLKVNLTIQFTVNKNGFIERVLILESTGNILWDNYIIEEFKRKYIFEQSDTDSIGILEIAINY